MRLPRFLFEYTYHLVWDSIPVDCLLLSLNDVEFVLDLGGDQLDVALDKVDVGGAHQAADLADVGRADLLIAVSSGHGLAQSDERLELADGDLVGRTLLAVLLVLSHALEFFLEHEGGLLGKAGLDGPTELNVGLESLGGEVGPERIFPKSVHLNNVSGYFEVLIVPLFVEDHEEEVETGHDWG
jgi:hypothetical protein